VRGVALLFHHQVFYRKILGILEDHQDMYNVTNLKYSKIAMYALQASLLSFARYLCYFARDFALVLSVLSNFSRFLSFALECLVTTSM
jgi:hypothetical protein